MDRLATKGPPPKPHWTRDATFFVVYLFLLWWATCILAYTHWPARALQLGLVMGLTHALGSERGRARQRDLTRQQDWKLLQLLDKLSAALHGDQKPPSTPNEKEP